MVNNISANSSVTELNYDIFPVILITIIILLALSLTSYSYNIILTAMASECDDKLNKETKKNVSNANVVPRDICMYERRKGIYLLHYGTCVALRMFVRSHWKYFFLATHQSFAFIILHLNHTRDWCYQKREISRNSYRWCRIYSQYTHSCGCKFLFPFLNACC